MQVINTVSVNDDCITTTAKENAYGQEGTATHLT